MEIFGSRDSEGVFVKVAILERNSFTSEIAVPFVEKKDKIGTFEAKGFYAEQVGEIVNYHTFAMRSTMLHVFVLIDKETVRMVFM